MELRSQTAVKQWLCCSAISVFHEEQAFMVSENNAGLTLCYTVVGNEPEHCKQSLIFMGEIHTDVINIMQYRSVKN